HYLALLPAKVVGENDLRFLAEGVVDAVAAKLSNLRQGYVAPASSVAAIASEQNEQKMANMLGVKILVQTTAQSSGQAIAFTISMYDVSKNRQLLKREFKGSTKDPLTLEDHIFGGLLNAL